MSAGISRRVLASFSSPRKASREIDRLGALEDQILEELSLGLRYKEIDDPLQLSIDTVRTQVAILLSQNNAFFTLMQHTVDANLTPASYRDTVFDTHSIEECFEALGVSVRA